MGLTGAMILSSLLGYVTLGFSVAAFIPLIITNMVKRRNGTGPIFLGVWLIADVINFIGIVLLGAQLTQIFLAAWYTLADGSMLIELLLFGHDDWPAPRVKPSSNYVKISTRTGWWKKVCEQFWTFSVWDDAKLAISCVLGGIAWFGIYTTIMVYQNPDYEIEHKTETTTMSFALGMAASLTFAAARVPEMISGFARSKRDEKPEHEVDDPLFWLLIFENIANLASIISLSQDPDYLWKAELPWMLGSIIPIIGDGFVIFFASRWQKKWNHPDNPNRQLVEAVEKERKDTLEAIAQHKLQLEEEWAVQDLKRDAQQKVAEPVRPTTWKPEDHLEYWGNKRARKRWEKRNTDFGRHLTHMTTIENRQQEREKGMHGGNPFRSKPASGSNATENPTNDSGPGSDSEDSDPGTVRSRRGSMGFAHPRGSDDHVNGPRR
ncbi:hypothetical protein JCM11641_000877 [Rhodosporidiobolus odoratus]